MALSVRDVVECHAANVAPGGPANRYMTYIYGTRGSDAGWLPLELVEEIPTRPFAGDVLEAADTLSDFGE